MSNLGFAAKTGERKSTTSRTYLRLEYEIFVLIQKNDEPSIPEVYFITFSGYRNKLPFPLDFFRKMLFGKCVRPPSGIAVSMFRI